ncbi:MAG: hypothetical protein J6R92_01430 [Akkermansia sp.]|nr:hypothetical protein [Akkermansia sp.]
MTRTRLLLLLILLTLLTCAALMLPGWFKNPRLLAQGEWQEVNKLGMVEVTDCSARWHGSNYKGAYQYTWLQDETEPYSIEVSRNKEKWLVSLTFEDDDHATVDFHIIDKLPPQAQELIRQKNRARNRPQDELRLRFRRLKAEK